MSALDCWNQIIKVLEFSFTVCTELFSAFDMKDSVGEDGSGGSVQKWEQAKTVKQ